MKRLLAFAAILFLSAGCPNRPAENAKPVKPVIYFAASAADREAYHSFLEQDEYAGVLIAYPKPRLMHLFAKLNVKVNLYFLADDLKIAETHELPRMPYSHIIEIPGAGSSAAYRYALLLKAPFSYEGEVERLVRQEVPRLKPEEMPFVQIGDTKIDVEVCETDDKRQRGYMYRTRVSADEGMLFMYREPSQHSFWMKNCPMAISVAFINDEMKICNIEDMAPFDDSSQHLSSEIVRYALEVPQGYLTRRGIKPHDTVIFSDSLKKFTPK